MSFELFCAKIQEYADGCGVSVRFSSEDGKHMAFLPDGNVITANSITPSVTYRDRNHCYQKVI